MDTDRSMDTDRDRNTYRGTDHGRGHGHEQLQRITYIKTRALKVVKINKILK